MYTHTKNSQKYVQGPMEFPDQNSYLYLHLVHVKGEKNCMISKFHNQKYNHKKIQLNYRYRKRYN